MIRHDIGERENPGVVQRNVETVTGRGGLNGLQGTG